jgi:hypothetical protein
LGGYFFKFIRDGVQSFIPGYAFKFAFTALSNSFHGVFQAIRMVGHIQAGQTSQAYSPVSGIGEVRRFNFYHPVFFDMRQNTAGINPAMRRADGSNYLCVFIDSH